MIKKHGWGLMYKFLKKKVFFFMNKGNNSRSNECRNHPNYSEFQLFLAVFPGIFKNGTICFHSILYIYIYIYIYIYNEN